MEDTKIGGMGGRIDKLRAKPKDDKTAIAGGAAILVVAILLISWGIFFLRKIARENAPAQLEAQPYDLSAIRDTVGAGTYSGAPSSNSYSNNAKDPFGGNSSY